MKRCSKCGVEKDESEFNKEKRAKDGRVGYCKYCFNQRRKERNSSDERRAAAAARSKAWRESHRDQYLKSNRARMRRWVNENPELNKVRTTKWKKKNLERVLLHQAKGTLKRALGFAPPEALVEVKAVQYLINHQIKEMTK